MSPPERSKAEALLAELGFEPRLTVYLATVPGSGKTHRLLSDARFESDAGRRVAIGWVDTKGRPNLSESASALPRIPPKTFETGGSRFEDFDLEAALGSDYETIVLDELAHANPVGAAHAKRWQDALALRAAGKSVLGAFNVLHLETVAPVAERLIGYPIHEIVPMSFLRDADSVIALDVSPAVLEARLRAGRIVRNDDIERAAGGLFKAQNLIVLRELLLRTVDQLTVPVISPAHASTALAIVTEGGDARAYLRRARALADALDLALEVTVLGDGAGGEELAAATRDADATLIHPPARVGEGDLTNVRGALVGLPLGTLAKRVLGRPLDRDVYIVDPGRTSALRTSDGARHPYGQAIGDRQRIGYGKLTIYLGSVAGSGKTYAMLDRAHTMLAEGTDVVAALIETHGRVDTAAELVGIETLARLPSGELDREAVIRRRPSAALVDELAHTNAPDGTYAKRYDDVLSILRAGISVITTLNVQHLEGLSDAVERLTGMHVRETLPDTILEVADEIIFIDVSPEVLRARLRQGKIYPQDRIDTALTHFFRVENLTALRELAVRELMHARRQRRLAPPFDRILLGVRARVRDARLIEQMGRLSARLDVDLVVTHVAAPAVREDAACLELLMRAARGAKAKWNPVEAANAPAALVAAAADSGVIVVESPRRKRRLFGPPSFAARVLAAGARELLVLAPHERHT
ncbi:MAG: hypothetical protein M3R53_08030 [Candidatus Eremiobacteraeota bacterium]|nr:hypothetical protein [Candidatus Eremiobacteraeota bacterium]